MGIGVMEMTPAIVSGFATLRGDHYGYKDHTVLILGHQKGRDTKARRHRRFGMPNPEGYRKARRHMELAAKVWQTNHLPS